MLLATLRLMLGPILLWQGARVRREILRLPEPTGAREGYCGDGQPLSLLLLGDSSIAGVGAKTQEQALSGRLIQCLSQENSIDWQIIAKTGWTTKDALRALQAVEARPTDVVVIGLGVNDVTTETGIAIWLEQYQALVELLRDDWQTRMLILSGLPPMGAFPALPQPLREYLGMQAAAHQAALFENFAEGPDVICLPLAFDLKISAMAIDGFHPGPAVYGSWAANLANVIREHLPKTHSARSDPAADAGHQSIEI